MLSLPSLRFVKRTENARTPTRNSPKAAGVDLYSAYDVTMPARGNPLISTDLQIQFPEGCYGRIAPRSGMALEHHIEVGGGVIDEDCRGNLCVILFSHSDVPYAVSQGDRIAQLICENIYYPTLTEVQILDITERGEGGFDSTGRN